MTITIDEATKVITIEQSDLALIVGTLYELDTNAYRLAVGALLASERYMWMDPAFNHNGEVTVAGTTFARIIEQTNGYSLTFDISGTPPGDYIHRWDATDDSGIGYLTDPGTNDVNSWEDKTATITLGIQGSPTNYPEYVLDSDGLPCVHFQRDGTLDNSSSGLSAVNSTTCAVVRFNDLDSETSNAYCIRSWGDCRLFNTDGGGNKLTLYPRNEQETSADYNDRRCLLSATITHNGVNDNDVSKWCGHDLLETFLTTGDNNVDERHMEMGGHSGAFESDANVYELLVWDRVLTAEELTDVIDYLSYKWQVTNADEPTDTISGPPGVAYSVRLAGSNNNLFDIENGILVQNLVQVIAQNSAGLVRVDTGAADTTAIIQSVEDWGVINYSK